MQILNRRRMMPSPRWLAGWAVGAGLSAMACSGAIDEGGDPQSDGRRLEGNMAPPMMRGNDTSPGDDDGEAGSSMNSSEGSPLDADLDEGDGNDGASSMDGDEGDMAGDAMSVETPDVPDSEHCAAVADWDPEWTQFEEEVLLLVNENRAEGADCGVEGTFPPAAPVSMDPILRCSARLHSLDMYERDFFDHTNPDGVDPFVRMDAAGFAGSGGGENIAVGQVTPEQVMQSWMDSDGHCANVMRAAFTTLGVGYHPGAGQRGLGSNYWTQNFGAPPFMRGGGRNR